jgi:hypothetical protein
MGVTEPGPVQFSFFVVSSELAWLDAIKHKGQKCHADLFHYSISRSSCNASIVSNMRVNNCLRFALAGLHWRYCWSQAMPFEFT